ncbi:MAG: winged helix-turn-helix domain-containing protein [Gammaproteobacteria bacterium]|nr:winged helix-turn-helix domain-containing protein [Gammaproteobacteria bacterium]MDH4253559.1 winged helix-turn-helix domain-containing protein [Gammaproteobacteria bacterium]
MIYRFGSFELDLGKVELRSDGQPHPLEPQVFALLAFLVEHRERLVSRDEIFEKVWDRRVVSDSALSSRIKSVRKALGDDGKSQRFIKTVHGQGFRFVADVRVERVERDGAAAVAAGGAEPPADAVVPAAEADSASRPSIAVLPFRVIGDAGAYGTISEGLPHELITELARLRWLFVIARGSSFRLRDQDLDASEAGRLLGVRYCLTGTVEVTGQHLAVTTELVDTRRGDLVWAERYTGFVDDVHAVRAEIRSKILTSLEIQIPLHEAAGARLRSTADLDSWSAYHLGLQHLYRFNRKDNAIAAELFGRAVSRDPEFARAYAGLSFVHFQAAFLRQTEDIAGEIALARSLAQRGVDIDPLDPFVNFTMGRSFWLEADLDRAAAWLERATSLSPNYAQGIYAHAWTETMSGHGRTARGEVDLAMRLSPLDPLYYAMLGTRGFIHMAQGEDREAASWAERAARSPGAHVLIAMIAAVAQVLAGDEARARAWADNVRARNPLLTREDFFRSFPLRPESVRSRVSAALEKLGF